MIAPFVRSTPRPWQRAITRQPDPRGLPFAQAAPSGPAEAGRSEHVPVPEITSRTQSSRCPTIQSLRHRRMIREEPCMTAPVDPRTPLREFARSRDFFIGIDSDGCAFDTMEVKHKE